MKVAHRSYPLLLVASALLPGCGGDDSGSGTFDNSSGTGTGGSAGSDGGSSRDGSVGSGGTLALNTSDAGNGQIVLEDGDICAGQTATVAQIPFDMFIMLDQSLSMNEPLVKGSPMPTRWQAVSKAVADFVSSPDVSQLGVGIGYFGLPKAGSPGVTSCDVADYAKPAVEIGALSDPAVVMALTQSIAMHQPSSTTPTGPALGGALQHAKEWATAHPTRPTIVVFATDGVPSDCDPLGQDQISAMYVKPAADTDPKVRTFVIGAGPDGSLSVLKSFAQNGGTGAPVIVQDSPDTAKQVTDALLRISHTNVTCSYDLALPDGGDIDPLRVNVRLTDSAMAPRLLDYVAPPKMCTSSGGFFYDNPEHPKKVYLCGSTCSGLFNGSIEVIVGCPQRGNN